MKNNFATAHKNLRKIATHFDSESCKNKESIIRSLSRTPLPLHVSLIDYQNLLLFLAAHSHSDSFSKLINAELNRLSSFLKKSPEKAKSKLQNSGLPYTSVTASLTHDLLNILSREKEVKLNYHSSDEDQIELSQLLSFTLPDIEKDYTSAGFDQEELLETLGIKEKDLCAFLIEQLHQLNHVPFIKDYLLDKFNLYVTIEPETKKFSKAFNHFPVKNYYYHQDILKKFDHLQLINSALPQPENLSETERDELIETMQTALALLGRETDPCTFIDENSLRYFVLERGISVAIFGMIPERQMSMESYVGYTLFKNGYPCAYGGGWVYGKRSLFGINIFEQFRGGESGYILMQLLRTYKQVFKLNYFEVEPYQYGLDNPEGIQSGAFWFYYRYGFRPLNKELNKLAKSEAEKIKSKKDYRSSAKTLTRFTESNIGWLMEGSVPSKVTDLRAKITKMIEKKYQGSRHLAIDKCIKDLRKKTFIKDELNKYETIVLNDLSLVAAALEINSEEKLRMINELIELKPVDLYSYNRRLSAFLD